MIVNDIRKCRLDRIREIAERRFERKCSTARGKVLRVREVYTDDSELRVKKVPKLGKRGERVMLFRRTVEDDTNGVDCRICGRRLSQLQIHLTRLHGISCEAYRERYGADAPIMCDRLLRTWMTETIPAGVSASVKKHTALHESEPRDTCKICGAPFKRSLGSRHRVTCSDACRRADSSSRAKEAVAAGVMNGTYAPARLRYLEKMRANRSADRTRQCPICNRTWTSARRSKAIKAGTCSFECRTEWVRRRRHPTVVSVTRSD